jgi:ribosomal 30S subunit maturation factor RimM
MKDYKIAGSLINKFHRRLFSDGDNQIQIASKMKSLLNQQNHLDSETQNLKIKSQLFEKIDANDQLPDFPKILDLNQIKNNITLGSYQIKQCHGYIAEHKSVDGSYLIFANKQTFLTKNNNKLIAVEIQSRHSNNTKYKLFVEYTDIDSVDAIKGNNNLFFIFISLLKVYLLIKNIS